MNRALITLLLTAPPHLPPLPVVASVKTVVQCDEPKLTIIHVRDWHFVDRERFAIDVRDESDTELTDADVAELFEGHRVAVEVIQKQQKRVLRKLVKKLKIKQVYHEGFTAEQLPAYQKRIKTLKEFKPYLPNGDSGLDLLTRYEYQTDMLQIGAPGQLLIDRIVENLMEASGTAVIVLGGAHDLSDNVPPGVRLIEVTVKGYAEAAGESATREQYN